MDEIFPLIILLFFKERKFNKKNQMEPWFFCYHFGKESQQKELDGTFPSIPLHHFGKKSLVKGTQWKSHN
jgi:hypothetical protein